MPEKEQEVQKPESERTPRYRKPYSESYRHLYGLRQDVLLKTRQLEWSLDQLVHFVRDLLR